VIANRVMTTLGCLLGACGIALMALAAHGQWPTITYSAIMTLVHAPVLIAIAVSIRLGLLYAYVARPAGFLLAAAVALFSGEVSYFALTGAHLFPMAAPIGGTAAILAWLLLAVSAAMARPV
jgi:uncharacterized membrane protein YgdD (TMEM256/DUF423 family)